MLLVSETQTSTIMLPDESFITWRLGTGGNYEITNIRVSEPRRGTGTKLLRAMLKAVKYRPPYATVYGFTRTARKDSQAYYRAMGFRLSLVLGVYADGTAIVFSRDYRELCDKHGVI